PQHDFTSLKKLRPQSVTSRIQPGSDVIVCAEMDEQWGYVGAKSRQRWLFYAYDRLRKTVVAHVFGERTMATLGRLMSLLSPFDVVIWMTDDGSCYRANETRQFARMLGLEPKSTAVRSPESNGIAESFVKTIKRDYISVMPKPDGLTAAKNLAEAFEHYNEWHPHSALGYRSPREYLRQQASNGLSDNRYLEI
ncbi:IS1 family transposase, partial [Escherichia coli]|uniref:IS1 family transposase n=2 Tax=Escherichia coli TaxID=562 RepID=UPI0022F28C12